jgi:Peptidase_C39 like family
MARPSRGPSRIEVRMRPSVPALVAASALISLVWSCNEPATPARGAAGLTPDRGADGPAPDTAPRADAPRPASVRIDGIPHVLQKPDFCGEACAEMALRRLGKSSNQDDVFDRAGIDPALGRGATTRELKVALEQIGFQVGAVWYPVDAAAAAEGLEAQFAAVHADLRRGIPSILCMHYSDQPRTTEHFRLVVGYDAATDEVLYHEPAEENGAYRRMSRALLYRLWPLKYDPARWTVIRFPLEPGTLRDTPRAPGFSPAAYAQHVMGLRKKLPPGFTVVIEPPFVVTGDGPPSEVRERAQSTVKWAVSRLKRDFFTAEPRSILDIWLFRSESSYRTHTFAVFGDRPTTPYGYYSSTHKSLLMNIATGGGTLVHEIVHPFVEADFPDCPPWLNEGLGSLYEQSGEREGRIVGFTNWRLAGLQRAIKANRVPPFKDLLQANEHRFYQEDPGTNYAQARYLCYYLQEKGLLVRFYKEHRAARAADPSGYETLKSVLGEPDMDAFKVRWEAFVAGLVFN